MNAACIYLSLGTNLGDRLTNLQLALAALVPFIQIQAVSSVYETEPWGFTDQPQFLNQVLSGDTELPPQELLARLKNIESEIGRTPSFRYGPRLIDLDILYYDELILNLPGLNIPHSQLHKRAFVLVPLAEIAPNFIHPILSKTTLDLLLALDARGVHPYQTAPPKPNLVDSRSMP